MFGGFIPTSSPGHHPGPPGGLTTAPRPPAAIVFDFAKNQCAHIFSVLFLGGGKFSCLIIQY